MKSLLLLETYSCAAETEQGKQIYWEENNFERINRHTQWMKVCSLTQKLKDILYIRIFLMRMKFQHPLDM